MGRSEISESLLMDHLLALSGSKFQGSTYDLFEHNCNTFSNELCHFLLNKNIPEYITSLPREVIDTPIGALMKERITNMASSIHVNRLEDGTEFRHPIAENVAAENHCHTFNDIRQFFVPECFTEPLDPMTESNINQLSFQFESNKFLSTLKDTYKSLISNRFDNIDQNHHDLLDLRSLHMGFLGAEVVLEIYRRLLNDQPMLTYSLLSNPNKVLFNLPKNQPLTYEEETVQLANDETIKVKKVPEFICVSEEDYRIEVGKAKLLVNLFYTMSKELQIDRTANLQAICMEDVVGVIERLLEVKSVASIPSAMANKCIAASLRLALNMSYLDGLSEDGGFQLGCFLVHYAQSNISELSYELKLMLVKCVYILALRYSLIADLAKSCDIATSLQPLLDDNTISNKELIELLISLVKV